MGAAGVERAVAAAAPRMNAAAAAPASTVLTFSLTSRLRSGCSVSTSAAGIVLIVE
jgi:hypothetical protein